MHGFQDTNVRRSTVHTVRHSAVQGCQIFLDTIYQKRENIPNYHNITKGAIKYTK
jgi:hypothetical protein